jgi:hypothetical protein
MFKIYLPHPNMPVNSNSVIEGIQHVLEQEMCILAPLSSYQKLYSIAQAEFSM